MRLQEDLTVLGDSDITFIEVFSSKETGFHKEAILF